MNKNDLTDLTDMFKDKLTDIETTPVEVIPTKCLACVNNTICRPIHHRLRPSQNMRKRAD